MAPATATAAAALLSIEEVSWDFSRIQTHRFITVIVAIIIIGVNAKAVSGMLR